jgi:coenzyme F420-reducing hydrogenase delta subunit
MDTDICRWISEFVMRNTAAQDHVIKKLLRALPVSGADSRLKKTALLRTIQAEISDASLNETTLDNLEVMEELDRDDGAEISKALKAAYRAVAVECTVKYLAGTGDRHGKYFEAVKRVWRGRIGGLERSGRSELVTGELRRWGDDVEAAVWDAKVATRLLKVNTRNEALEAVRIYMGEAWALMGPTFLQSAATVAEPDGVQTYGASVGDLALKNVVNRVEEVAAKKVNQVEEVAVNTPCVGELAGKTMNQVEEVGAKTTPNAGQDVGELTAKKGNRVVANSRNVVELEAERVNQGQELAANMPNMVESDAEMVNRVEKVAANMPNVVELAAKTANWVAANMPNVVELEMETVNLVEELVGNTSNVSQDVGELSEETANQVVVNTPCVGELVGKTMNQVEEVGVRNTPNAGQDVGELAAKMAIQVVGNLRNVVELEAERVDQVEELAANMPNVVESDAEMVNQVEKVAANMPNVVELASKMGNRVAANMPNVVELEMETVNLVEEPVGNKSNVSQDVGELSGETANQVANTPNVGKDVGVKSKPELCGVEGRGLVALQSGSWDLIVRDRAAAGRVDGKFNFYYFQFFDPFGFSARMDFHRYELSY